MISFRQNILCPQKIQTKNLTLGGQHIILHQFEVFHKLWATPHSKLEDSSHRYIRIVRVFALSGRTTYKVPSPAAVSSVSINSAS